MSLSANFGPTQQRQYIQMQADIFNNFLAQWASKHLFKTKKIHETLFKITIECRTLFKWAIFINAVLKYINHEHKNHSKIHLRSLTMETKSYPTGVA